MGMPRGGSELEGSDAILLTKLIRRVVAGGIDYENEFAAITIYCGLQFYASMSIGKSVGECQGNF
jgi:hypothetical protein